MNTEKKLKIYIYTPNFFPKVGGLEIITQQLAEEFVKGGHVVKIATETAGLSNQDLTLPFEIVRKPSFRTQMALLNWSDIYFQPNVSLKGILPWFLKRKPVVFMHQSWYTTFDWKFKLRNFIAKNFGHNTACSQALANFLPFPCVAIPNTYRKEVFKNKAELERSRELCFLGRLVTVKGVADLIDALVILKKEDLLPRLTIIGTGDQENSLREKVDRAGLQETVTFLGELQGDRICDELNRHKILVVPSTISEAFGIVCLEGIASGCAIVASDSGGIPEAVGECGLIFKATDSISLADALKNMLSSDINTYLSFSKEHLERHSPENVAKKYIQFFEQIIK